METPNPEKIFSALAQPARYALYRRLLAAGDRGLTRAQLMEEWRFKGGALTGHTHVLEEAGLIEILPESRRISQINEHGSGGFLCRARLEPLRYVVRVLAHQDSAPAPPRLASSRGSSEKPLTVTGGQKPIRTVAGSGRIEPDQKSDENTDRCTDE